MKKVLVIVICFCLLQHAAQAQFILNEMGASIIFGTGTEKDPFADYKYRVEAAFQGTTFYPRFNILNYKKSAISISGTPTIGLNGFFGSRGGGRVIFGFDLPITVDYHMGYGAKKEDDTPNKGFGGFVGGGFSYTYSNDATTYYTNGKVNSVGPAVHAGIRFLVGGSRSITLRGYYKKGLDNTNFSFYGGSLLYRL
jgi:hypothetical protein